jgi:L-asparagine transporter-like permease
VAECTNPTETKKGDLKWWQLSLIGVACIIGTGFFLGSSIAIKKGGPSVLIAFLTAAVLTYIVFGSLAKMTADHPAKGSFRSYAKEAFGRWAGFSNGWVYWTSELLIMGSQLTALGLFAQFWFPDMALWILTSIFGALGLGVIVLGTKGFEKVENVFAVMKIAAIVMFITLAILGIFGFFDQGGKTSPTELFNDDFFPNGVKGLWMALIYAFYAFGGIEVLGLMSTELEDPKDAPKAGSVMLILLTTIYLLSIGLALTLHKWNEFNTEESPFIVALRRYDINWVPHVFNGVLIIAGFSTMVASLFAITNILVQLAEEGDAPELFAKKSGKKETPYRAICLTTGGLVLSILVSLLLPDNIYENITTAASLMLIYTWMFILFTYKKIIKLNTKEKIKRYIGIIIILIAVSGTTLEKSSRLGFFISLGFVAIIGFLAYRINKKEKLKPQKESPSS